MFVFVLLPNHYVALFKIPHPGYKGRHGRVFFNFVEVDTNFCIWLQHSAIAVFFFGMPCAALCVQADVSARG